MTADGTKETTVAINWQARTSVQVWRQTTKTTLNVDDELLGVWGWDLEMAVGEFFPSATDDDLTDADRRAIKAAEPTGDPVVRLEVKA